MNVQRSGYDPVISSIQYLRAAAAISVAVYHLGNRVGINFEVGAAGVDLFFVISGFIMWTVTTKRHSHPGPFIIDRVVRIAPPYILLTVLTYLVAFYIPSVFPNMHISLRHMALSALFIPHADIQRTDYPLIISGWTLNYEIFFYLVFALMLYVPLRHRLLASTAAFASMVAVGLLVSPEAPAGKVYTNPLLLEFCAGLWLGSAWLNKRVGSARQGAIVLFAGGAGLILWQILDGANPGSWRALAWGLPALLVVAGALTLERHGAIPFVRPLLLLGNASYSIYLVNAFTTAAAWRLLHRLPLPVYYAGGMALSVGGGLAFWRLVERPLTSTLRRLLHRPVPVSDAPLPVAP